MNPLYFLRANPWAKFLNADKGGASGGTASVADLNKQIADLQGEKQTLTTQLAEANTAKTTAETQLATANQKVSDLTTQLATANTNLTNANTKIADLEKNAKTVQQTAAEQAAANGVPPTAKQNAATAPGNGSAAHDGKQHYDAYQAAQKEGNGGKAADIWQKHSKEIEAYVASLEN